jgi:glycosyltransferase involved in cell wall biosynthesis
MKILIVLPAYNEQIVLAQNTREVFEFCQANFNQDTWEIVIADNKSTDQTKSIAQDLVRRFPRVSYLYLPIKGKGLAWKTAFLQNQADIYIVMDVDLAVALPALKELVANIKSGYDLVLGSRYLDQSQVKRSNLRSLTSVIYRWLVRFILGSRITDFQCGFKALNNEVKRNILAKTVDQGFFLDTELVTWTEKAGYKIKEIPVIWEESREAKRKSTVNIFETTFDYLIKVWRLRKKLKLVTS